MATILFNNKTINIRQLEAADNYLLIHYLQSLSVESRSRFGPHSFDEETVNIICNDVPGDTSRYVAIDPASGKIVAYMLIKQGMIEWDMQRYAQRNQYYESATTVTFAPSVADEWQSSGLGTVMNNLIETDLKERKIKHIILWGGVQATNEKAMRFYTKLGYQRLASFFHDGKNNYDMVKVVSGE